MSSEVFWGIVGLMTSLVTFWLGYRQTVGARKERIRSADRDIEELALKRIILEDWRPSHEDLERIIAGVATSLEVPASSLRQPEDLGNLLMTRTLQNDLISRDKRQDVLVNALPIIKPVTATAQTERQHSAGYRESRASGLVTTAVAIVAVGLGVLVNFIPEIRSQDFSFEGVIPFVVVATAIVGFSATLLAFRTSGSTASGFAGGSRESRARAETLMTYPNDSEIQQALDIIDNLSPFAASSLGDYMNDEVESLRRGWQPGAFVRPGGTPWHKELVDKGLLASVQPPHGIEGKGREFLTLTSKGRLVGRTLVANNRVPSVLLNRFKSSNGSAPFPQADRQSNPATSQTGSGGDSSTG